MSEETRYTEAVVALFDVDNTITPDYSIIDFASFLTKKGNFDSAQWAAIEDLKAVYKVDRDYNKFADNIVLAYGRGIAGQDVEGIATLSSEFWGSRIETIFPFIHTVMRELGDAKKIAISGSPLESLAPLLQFLGFDAAYTTKVKISNGKYESDIELNAASQSQKEMIVADIMAEIPEDTVTYGFGDSVADLAFLSLVANPTVVGTHDKDLQQVALEKGWKIETSHERS